MKLHENDINLYINFFFSFFQKNEISSGPGGMDHPA